MNDTSEVPDAENRLEMILDWCDAYPEDVFIPVSNEDLARAHKLCEEAGISLGAIHGQWARHLLSGIKRIAEGD